jgi:hypothetical protein
MVRIFPTDQLRQGKVKGSNRMVHYQTIYTMTAKPITISYNDLITNTSDIPGKIQLALGSTEGCLGIIVISDLPSEFKALRERLFHLASKLATSSDEVKRDLERPDTHYLFGWSHGQEKMNGVCLTLWYIQVGADSIETGSVQGVLLCQSTTRLS